MRAGGLRHFVTFERSTVSQSATGAPVNSWATLAQTWARVEALAGKERFAAMQQQADVDYRITCRYESALASLAPNDRVTWGANTYDIQAVINPDERGAELQVFARKAVT